jgi:hypothetical protein
MLCSNSIFQNVSSVSLMLQQVLSCCKCVYLYVAYVFTHMMQVFYLDVVYVYNGFKCFQVFFSSISYACFKCFIYFPMYVAIITLDVSKLDQV